MVNQKSFHAGKSRIVSQLVLKKLGLVLEGSVRTCLLGKEWGKDQNYR
jgi:hypothetical protein